MKFIIWIVRLKQVELEDLEEDDYTEKNFECKFDYSNVANAVHSSKVVKKWCNRVFITYFYSEIE